LSEQIVVFHLVTQVNRNICLRYLFDIKKNRRCVDLLLNGRHPKTLEYIFFEMFQI